MSAYVMATDAEQKPQVRLRLKRESAIIIKW